MNKVMTLILLAAFGFAGPAMAMTPEEAKEARYQEVKKAKDAQREAKDIAKKNEAASPSPKAKGFWEKEGERSGMNQNGNRFGETMRSLNPLPFFKNQEEKYNARKSAGVK